MSTANGEMIFGMNLVFGQRERKEIGARTKRAMEEMALEKIHTSRAPYGYIRNNIHKCPLCGEILAASESFKKYKNETKIYYHLRCKNTNCKGYCYHYNSDKIEDKLKRILNELTRFMYDNSNEIITCNSTKSKEVKEIEKAIEKLKV